MNTIEDRVELCKKVNKKHRAFGGNCGSFALALARELSKQNIKCSLTVCSSIDEEDLEEMDYSPRAYEDFETDIYHVALYVGDTLVDGSGKISINDLKKIAREEYSDNNPEIYTHDYNKENDNDFRYAFEWGTNHDVYPEYYQKLIQKELGINEEFSLDSKAFERRYKEMRCAYSESENNYKGLEDKYAQYRGKECTIVKLDVNSIVESLNDFNRSYWTIRFDDNTTLEMVSGKSLTPIDDLEDNDCLEVLNLLNK